jgi:hypothetical protein
MASRVALSSWWWESFQMAFFPAWMKAMGMDTAQLSAKKPRRIQDLADMAGAPWATVERLFAAIPEIADLFADIFDSSTAWVEPRGDMEANLPQDPATGAVRSRSYIKLVDEFGRLTAKDIAISRAHQRDRRNRRPR